MVFPPRQGTRRVCSWSTSKYPSWTNRRCQSETSVRVVSGSGGGIARIQDKIQVDHGTPSGEIWHGLPQSKGDLGDDVKWWLSLSSDWNKPPLAKLGSVAMFCKWATFLWRFSISQTNKPHKYQTNHLPLHGKTHKKKTKSPTSQWHPLACWLHYSLSETADAYPAANTMSRFTWKTAWAVLPSNRVPPKFRSHWQNLGHDMLVSPTETSRSMKRYIQMGFWIQRELQI